MALYAIIRREGWRTGGDLEEAAARSSDVGDNEMSDDIRWIRSYVLAEDSGQLGTVCIYEASSPDKIREHASRADCRSPRSSRSPTRSSCDRIRQRPHRA